MGFLERILDGETFKRQSVQLSVTAPNTTGSVNVLGSSYILLGVTRNNSSGTCRIRLYGSEVDRDADAPRPSGDFNYNTSDITLHLDAQFSDGALSIPFDPPVVVTTYYDSNTYYNIESSVNDLVSVLYFPIQYNYDDELGIEIPPITLLGGQTASGEITVDARGEAPMPKSFIMLETIATQSLANQELNVDPTWATTQSADTVGFNSSEGWQRVIGRQLTSTLTTNPANKVSVAFPAIATGSAQYAAQISTRGSQFLLDGQFYSVPVTVGDTYNVSGWVYASGSTFLGIQNGGSGTTDSPIGYIVTLLNAGLVAVDFKPFTYATGTQGWRYISETFIIEDPDVKFIRVAPFIDGPHPYLLDSEGNQVYGPPVCSEADAIAGCPGFAWFTGLEFKQFIPPEEADINLRLRLYSEPVASVPAVEQSRPYGAPVESGSKLIIDMLYDTASYAYRLTPVLQGFNLESYDRGENRVGYILENMSEAPVQRATIGMVIYPLEN